MLRVFIQSLQPAVIESQASRTFGRSLLRRSCLYLVAALVVGLSGQLLVAQESRQLPRVAILDFAVSALGTSAADSLAANLKSHAFLLLDRDQSRSAASGIGYKGSLNLERQYARDLGAALGSEFYIIGDAQTLRRSPSNGTIYYESYASIFLVSARTGNLLTWMRPSCEASTPGESERLLLATISAPELKQQVSVSIRRAQEDESQQRNLVIESAQAVIEEAPQDDQDVPGLQLPRPFRRLRPKYPDTAARAEAEATVDVLADIDAQGKVKNVELARWAGFGLDQATIETVRQLDFYPAHRDGAPIAMRVLLRYNFRKPEK